MTKYQNSTILLARITNLFTNNMSAFFCVITKNDTFNISAYEKAFDELSHRGNVSTHQVAEPIFLGYKMYSHSKLETFIKIENDQIIAKRDFFGEQTLFVFENIDILIISSEYRAILSLIDLDINSDVLETYMHTRHLVVLRDALYCGVQQILPGETWTINLNTFDKKIDVENVYSLFDVNLTENFKTRSEESLIDELDELMKLSIKNIIPNDKFASVVSGGVDSTLVSHYVKNMTDTFLSINHKDKDYVTYENVSEYFNVKCKVLYEKEWSQKLNYIYKHLKSPLFSHSSVGCYFLSLLAKQNECEVLLTGDAADAVVYGGKNLSDYEMSLYNQYKDAKYDHIEKPITLHLYIPQTVCLESDMLGKMNQVDFRSPFLNKDLLRFTLNLPIKYRYNLEVDKHMREKYLLKKLFIKYFSEEKILPKQGFSGYPNESKKYMNVDIKHEDRDVEWKLLNLEYFYRSRNDI